MTKILLLFFVSLNIWAFDHSHKKFDQILNKYLVKKEKQTLFAYSKLKKDQKLFGEYLKELSSVTLKEYQGFSKMQKIAFLINAYNAFTIEIILREYPVTSIKDIGSFFKSTWKIKFFKLLEEDFYLDRIEHEILRKDFNEPRIHFAVNCASISCPSLYPEAFKAKVLDKQLDLAAKNFLGNTEKNRIDGSQLRLSKIFDWYGDDFNKSFGSFYSYIAPLMTKDLKVQKKIANKELEVSYLKYDWKLNDAK